MALHPQEVPPVPEERRRVVYTAFPRGNVYIRMRDALGLAVLPRFADRSLHGWPSVPSHYFSKTRDETELMTFWSMMRVRVE